MIYTIESLLIPQKDKYKLTPVAGMNGVSNTVSWIYVAEDISTTKFLKKNELIITTGLFTQNGTDLKSFIEAIISQQASGIIINIGAYISESDISEDIYDLCDKHHLPLYLMPWEIRFTDVLQELCSPLIEVSHNKQKLSDAFIHLISSKHPKRYTDILSANGFMPDNFYAAAVFDSFEEDIDLTETADTYHIFRYDGYSVLVSTSDKIQNIDICIHNAHSGISCTQQGIDKIPALFKQASDALRAAVIRGKTTEHYKDIGVLSLIFDSSSKDELKRKTLKRLAPVLEYDRTHAASLIDTLFHYIRTGGSLSETAKLTFTHRNTAGYRMNKLRELCQTDFSDTEERFNYLTAIYILKTIIE